MPALNTETGASEIPSGTTRKRILGSTGSRIVPLLLLLLTLAQFVQTVLHFEPVHGIFNEEPIYSLDYSIGYYYIESGRQRFMTTGHFHGYDPYFMAGHPEIYLQNNNILLTNMCPSS